MIFNEATIRDSLARNIEILEPGLKLEKKEKFIPNHYGTKSFIDLVAYDKEGRIVLIEVKRTNQAAREATHEVLKYIEGVKQHLRLREDEIRVIVVSPTWVELLVPFSSLVNRTTCQVEGFNLELSASGEVTGSEIITPLDLRGDRLIAPWHELRYYIDEIDCRKAIAEYEVACQSKGIESFVLLELSPSEGHEEGIASPKQATMQSMISMMAGGHPAQSQLPVYKRALYFGMQQLSEQEYTHLLQQSPQDTSETFEYIENMSDEEERLLTLHEALLDLHPHPSSEFFEIGTPAKLSSRILTDDGWNVAHFHRYGAFDRNYEILPDGQILKELSGEEGSSTQVFRKKFNPSVKSQVAEVTRGVESCLSNNPAWRRQISEVLREIVEADDATEVHVDLYHPSTALLTFHLALRVDDPLQYLPNYAITRKVDGENIFIFGCLMWDGSSSSLKSVLKKHYNSSKSEILHPLLWGGYDTRDTKVMQTIGLRYRTVKVHISGQKRNYYLLSDEGWEPTEETDPLSGVRKLLNGNPKLIHEIMDFYSEHWDGRMVIFDELK